MHGFQNHKKVQRN